MLVTFPIMFHESYAFLGVNADQRNISDRHRAPCFGSPLSKSLELRLLANLNGFTKLGHGNLPASAPPISIAHLMTCFLFKWQTQIQQKELID